jgi:hypothetical protein
MFMGLRVRVRRGKIREPDIAFLHKDNFHARHNRVWDGANLVMEVMKDDPKDRERYYEQKLGDYAEAKMAAALPRAVVAVAGPAGDVSVIPI